MAPDQVTGPGCVRKNAVLIIPKPVCTRQGRRDRCLASEHNKAPKLRCKLGRPGTGRLAEVALSGAVRSYRPAVNAVTVPNAPKCPCKNEHSRAVQPYLCPSFVFNGAVEPA